MIENMFDLEEADLEAIQRDTYQIYRECLDPRGKGFVTRDDIRALSQETLKEIARRSEAPHGPVAGSPADRGAASKFRMEEQANEYDDDERESDKEGRDEL